MISKPDALKIVRNGWTKTWNQIREKYKDQLIDLSFESLGTSNLSGFDFSTVDLRGSDLSENLLESIEEKENSKIRHHTIFKQSLYDANSKFPDKADPAEWGAEFSIPPSPDTRSVIHVSANTPYTTRKTLADLFDKFDGKICICDPYYGEGTLNRLDNLTQCKPIHFLTQNPAKNGGKPIKNKLIDWIVEHGDSEARLHTDGELHDRYILTGDQLILLGHGLEDIGSKESFVVIIEQASMPGLLKTVRQEFEKKWDRANLIQ